MPWTIRDINDLSKQTTDKSSATTQFMNDAYRQVTVLLGQTTDASQQGTAKTNESVTKPTVDATGVASKAASAGTTDGSNKTDEGTAKTNKSVTEPASAGTDEASKAASKVTADGSSKTTAGTAAVSATVANTAGATAENSATAIGGTVASGIESANQTATKQTVETRIKLLELDQESALCNASAEVTSATKQAIELPDLQKTLEAAKEGAKQGAEMYRAGKEKSFCPTVLRKPQGQQLEQKNNQNQNT